MIVVFALLAAASPQSQGTSVAPSASAAIDAERAAVAIELAEVLNSRELTRVQIAKLLDETFPKAFAQNPQTASLEKEHPGAIAVMITAMRPLLIEYTMEALPGMWREIAPVYADALSTAEMRQLLAFYRGPTGVRVIEAMGRGADYGGAINRMLDSGDTNMTTSDLNSGAARGVAEVIRGATAEDTAAMVALMHTSAGKKLPAVSRVAQERVAAWSARPTPEFDARIEKVTADALAAHIAKGRKP